jgi:hypothetical protein
VLKLCRIHQGGPKREQECNTQKTEEMAIARQQR